MKTYKLSGADSFSHIPEAPERTSRKYGLGFDFDVTYKVWPSRKVMAVAIRAQQRREPRPDDWKAVVPLSDGEGY